MCEIEAKLALPSTEEQFQPDRDRSRAFPCPNGIMAAEIRWKKTTESENHPSKGIYRELARRPAPHFQQN
jgi:hypothetical protein